AIRRKKELMGERRGRPARENVDEKSTISGVRGRTQDLIAEQLGMSGKQVARYDSLNDLIPEFQCMVDEGKLGVNAGEKLSRLPAEVQKVLFDALGDEVASLSAEEVKRLKEEVRRTREESERGYFVLEVMKKRIEELEAKVKEYGDIVVDRDRMLEELKKLRQKKEELECAVLNRESAIKRVTERAEKKGVALLEIVTAVARPLMAMRPDMERLLEEGAIGEGFEELLLKYAKAFCEVGTMIDTKVREVKEARKQAGSNAAQPGVGGERRIHLVR
ncbi:MAG: hypothetical protein ACPLRM_03470, partial [Anaerolineae bacterium]